MLNEFVLRVTEQINYLSGGNEFLAATLFLYLAGTATFLLRDVPRRVFEMIKRHTITSMTLNNGGHLQEEIMYNFMKWLRPNLKDGWSRSISVSNDSMHSSNKPIAGVGYGIHFFFYKRRFYWLNKQKLESSGSERQKDEITISSFGRSHKPFRQMIEDFTPVEEEEKLWINHLDTDGDWMRYANVQKRPLNTVAMDQNRKNELVGQISHMKENREWFLDRGIPHKLTYLIHGVPGGGKTSIIKALASHFGMNICVININQITDKALEMGLATVPSNSMVIIEDFDSSEATKSRDSRQEVFGKTEMLTLTGLLNALDGVHPLDDCVMFLTTNHLEHIDPALYRKGRVDHLIEVGKVGHKEIMEYSRVLYPDHDFSGIEFNPIMGNMLHQALLYGKDDPEMYLECLRENGGIKD